MSSKKKDSLKPWLSRPTVNRSVTLPFTRPLTQRLSNLNEFHPNELDPYLLFDARDSMVGTLENPTLDLDPSKPDTLNVITATRAGAATYTDASGLIQAASPNTVRVDQTQGAELTPTKYQRFVNTDFNESFWSFNSAMTSVYNYDTAPNGEQDAVRVVSTGGAWPQVLETVQTLTIGQQYTASFYVKSDGTSQIQQSTHFTGLSGGVGFTPTDGWERISFTITATATSHTFVVFTNNGSAPASSFLIWGPQLEEGTTASDFVANTTGSPKFITGATYGPRVPMILVEPSATNLVPYSEDFSNAAWSKGVTTVTPSFADSPDGTTSASKITGIEGTDGDGGLSELVDASPSTTYTFSSYFKAASDSDVGKKVRLRQKRNGGSIVTSSEQVILSSEWVRHSVTMTTLSDNTGVWATLTKDPTSPIAERADECLIWGAQIETGTVATSYIATSGSTVTRAKDDLVITGSDFTNFYNQSEGTFYVEYVMGTDTGQPFVIDVDNGDDNRIIIYNANGNNLVKFIKSLGTSTVSDTIDTRSPVGALSRVALSYATNNVQASQDGGNVVTDTSATIPTNINRLSIGSRYGQSSVYKLNGHIKRLLYWPLHSDSL